MTEAVTDRIHALEVQMTSASLLVPSATIAEVVNLDEIHLLPGAPDWALGIMPWRKRALAIISLEKLIGIADAKPKRRSKVVVFYPIPGCQSWEFFGILTSSEPQPNVIDHDTELPLDEVAGKKYHYAAATLKINQKIFIVPDLAALKETLYPQVS